MGKNKIWENKKIERHSIDFYKWLLNACEKRNLTDGIWVIYDKRRSGFYEKNTIIKILNRYNEA